MGFDSSVFRQYKEHDMQITRAEQANIKQHNLEQRRLQDKRDEDYRKVVEKRSYERIIEDRVDRNRRLDLDKGRNIDIEC
jgi:hypothetical protein